MQTDKTIWSVKTHTPPYAKLRVVCAGREYTPTHVAFDRLIFAAPPRLTANTLEVGVTIDGQERCWTATVQPHSPDDAEIGIRLV
jgi:hypothetical protein